MLGRFSGVLAAGLLVVLVATVAGATTAAAQSPQAVSGCPVPVENADNGVEVCVDRGEGAVYQAGDPITICVTANIPVILIFPPPPPPAIRVLSSTNGGPEQLLFQVAMQSGQECRTFTIVPPYGQELIRAEAVGSDGRAFASDSTTFVSVGAP